MRVEWDEVAVAQLERLVANRSEWSARSAKELHAAIIQRSDQLADFPQSGRMIPEFQMPHLREVLEQGFRILYEVREDRIEVFGVVSSRQDPFRED